MTENDIVLSLIYGHKTLSDTLYIPNIYIGGFERDFIVVDKDSLLWEYEIKVSVSDFNRDIFKNKWDKGIDNSSYFTYCFPNEMLSKIPKWVTGIPTIGLKSYSWYDGIYYPVGQWVRNPSKIDGKSPLTMKDRHNILFSCWKRYIKQKERTLYEERSIIP